MTASRGATVDFPSARDEAWRYSPVDEIVHRYRAAATAWGDASPPRWTAGEIDALAGDHDGLRLVLVNGLIDDAFCRVGDLPSGVWCGRLDVVHDRTIVNASLAAAATAPAGDGFRVRHRAECRDAAVIVVDPDVTVVDPVHVVHVTAPVAAFEGAGDIAVHPRTIVDVGDHSRVVVIETHGGATDASVTNATTVVRVGRGAVVDYCRLQTEADGLTHVGQMSVVQGADSVVRLTSLMLGADIARIAADVVLDGPDARFEFSGLSVAGRRQRHDTVVSVDHASSHSSSTQRYAAVVDDHGRSSFGGEIIVRPGTVGTDAHQLTRSLLLSPDAQADARPWLRILADDVRCTHGATVGRLDDEALFYLRSRGVPAEAARTMLIDAFVAEIVDGLPVPSLRSHVADLVAGQRGRRAVTP